MSDLTLIWHGYSSVTILFAGLGIGLYLYLSLKRRQLTNSAVGRVLTMIRFLVLIALTLLALRPELQWQSRRKVAPKVLIAVDNSQSMTAQKGFQSDSLIAALQVLTKRLESKRIQPVNLSFSDRVDERSTSFYDKLRFDGLTTDLSAVLRYFQNKTEDDNIVGAILISDGISTAGEDPLTMDIELPFPIYTVGVGDTAQIFDPRLMALNLPTVARVGDTIAVMLEYVPIGRESPIELLLEVNGRLSNRRIVKPQSSEFVQADTLSINFQQPGLHQVKVTLKAEDDANPYNNWVEKLIRVQAARQKIAIIDGSGSNESKFLKMILADSKSLEVLNTLQTPRGYLPLTLPSLLNQKWGAAVFIDYPNTATPENDLISLKRKLNHDRIPVWWWVSDKTDLKKLGLLSGAPIFASAVLQRNPEPTSLNWWNIDWTHPILHNVGLEIEPEQVKNLPPVGMPFKQLRLAPEWHLLLKGTMLQGEVPLMAAMDVQGERQLVTIGHDFWRWYFLSEQRAGFYLSLVKSAVSYLADTLSRERVILNLNRELLMTGEVLAMETSVFDLTGRLIPQAQVEAAIETPDGKTLKIPQSWTGKCYLAQYLCTQAGQLKVSASAKIGNQQYSSSLRSVQVTSQPIELLQVRQNQRLLHWLSTLTAGQKLSINALRSAHDLFSYHAKSRWVAHDLKFWRSPAVILFLITLLCSEWVLRRRYGLQ